MLSFLPGEAPFSILLQSTTARGTLEEELLEPFFLQDRLRHGRCFCAY